MISPGGLPFIDPHSTLRKLLCPSPSTSTVNVENTPGAASCGAEHVQLSLTARQHHPHASALSPLNLCLTEFRNASSSLANASRSHDSSKSSTDRNQYSGPYHCDQKRPRTISNGLSYNSLEQIKSHYDATYVEKNGHHNNWFYGNGHFLGNTIGPSFHREGPEEEESFEPHDLSQSKSTSPVLESALKSTSTNSMLENALKGFSTVPFQENSLKRATSSSVLESALKGCSTFSVLEKALKGAGASSNIENSLKGTTLSSVSVLETALKGTPGNFVLENALQGQPPNSLIATPPKEMSPSSVMEGVLKGMSSSLTGGSSGPIPEKSLKRKSPSTNDMSESSLDDKMAETTRVADLNTGRRMSAEMDLSNLAICPRARSAPPCQDLLASNSCLAPSKRRRCLSVLSFVEGEESDTATNISGGGSCSLFSRGSTPASLGTCSIENFSRSRSESLSSDHPLSYSQEQSSDTGKEASTSMGRRRNSSTSKEEDEGTAKFLVSSEDVVIILIQPPHKKPLPVFICRKCGKQFRKQVNITLHLRAHASSPGIRGITPVDVAPNSLAEPHQCHVCSKSFTLTCNLQKHLLTHAGYRPYKCHLCFRVFSQKGNLFRHLTQVHAINDPHMRCVVCGERFPETRKNKLRLHEARCRASSAKKASGEKWRNDKKIDLEDEDDDVVVKEEDEDCSTRHVHCWMCNAKFVSKEQLYSHSLNVHGPGELQKASMKNIVNIEEDICLKTLLCSEKYRHQADDDQKCEKRTKMMDHLQQASPLFPFDHVTELKRDRFSDVSIKSHVSSLPFQSTSDGKSLPKSHPPHLGPSCAVCHEKFGTNLEMIRHCIMLSHFEKQTTSFAPPLPTFIKPKIENLAPLTSDFSPPTQVGQELKFQCRFCPATFTLLRDLQVHLERLHQIPLSRSDCSPSLPAPPRKNSFSRVIKTEHQDTLTPSQRPPRHMSYLSEDPVGFENMVSQMQTRIKVANTNESAASPTSMDSLIPPTKPEIVVVFPSSVPLPLVSPRQNSNGLWFPPPASVDAPATVPGTSPATFDEMLTEMQLKEGANSNSDSEQVQELDLSVNQFSNLKSALEGTLSLEGELSKFPVVKKETDVATEVGSVTPQQASMVPADQKPSLLQLCLVNGQRCMPLDGRKLPDIGKNNLRENAGSGDSAFTPVKAKLPPPPLIPLSFLVANEGSTCPIAPETSPDDFICPLCKRTFTLKSSLKRHLKKRHTEAELMLLQQQSLGEHDSLFNAVASLNEEMDSPLMIECDVVVNEGPNLNDY